MSADFKVDTQIQLPQFSTQLSISFSNVSGSSLHGEIMIMTDNLDILLTGVNSALTRGLEYLFKNLS